MEYPFELKDYDLVTPDGSITNLTHLSEKEAEALVFIEHIPQKFVGFQIEPENIFFNLKSTLAQVGLEGIGTAYQLDSKNHCAEVKVSRPLETLELNCSSLCSLVPISAAFLLPTRGDGCATPTIWRACLADPTAGASRCFL